MNQAVFVNKWIVAGMAGVVMALLGGNVMVSAAEQGGPPLEQRAPNGADQKPFFAGQTRAPSHITGVRLDVQVVASGLDRPWGFQFLPGGGMVVTEKSGQLRLVDQDGRISSPVAGAPTVAAVGQGGLLDVALDPNFAANNLIYLSYAEPAEAGARRTTLARARLHMDGNQPRLSDVQVIFRQQPALSTAYHFGSRIVFAADGTLFLTLGDRGKENLYPQDLASTVGKVVRLNPDGSIPADNPFVGRPGVRGEIWSYGHRNIQGAALHPDSKALWTVEHGARGGDELNQPQAGRNYGWPAITYGTEYSGRPVGAGITQKEGMEQPVYYWDPSYAPSGMMIYTGNLFPMWRGDVFIGTLAGMKLLRLRLKDGKVSGEEWLLTDREERIRDVRQGPDGAIYVATDDRDGKILRLTPAKN